MSSRQRVFPIIVASAAMLVLSACGGSGSSDEEAAPAAAKTRTVESTFTGEKVEIPVKPKRIVALWRTGSELVDIGVKPVAQMDGEISADELGEDVFSKVGDVPVVGTYEEVDIEKLIAAKPDLIVGMDNGGLGLDYTDIKEVAPTVILKIAEPTDVWRNYTTIADLAGKSTDFETKQAALDAKLEAVKAEHGATIGDLSVTALGTMGGEIWVDTAKSLLFERITGAGFGYNPAYTDNPERYVEALTFENIPELAEQDAIFYDVDITGKPSAETQKVLDAASFKRLPAAEAGKVFPVASGTIYTFAAANKQVDDLAAAAADLSDAS